MIIFGFRRSRKQLGTVFTLCRQCGQPCAHAVVALKRWFTLFFIPVIPLGATYIVVCAMCGGAVKIDKAGAEQLIGAAQPQPTAPEMTPDGPITPYGALPVPQQGDFQNYPPPAAPPQAQP